MAATLGALGADPFIGHCACLRRELSGEPDAGNLHLRFDEGRVGRGLPSPSLLLYRLANRRILAGLTACYARGSVTGAFSTA